jgi:hypothetical protein
MCGRYTDLRQSFGLGRQDLLSFFRLYLCKSGDLMKASYNWKLSLGLYGNLADSEILLVMTYLGLKINNIIYSTIIIAT